MKRLGVDLEKYIVDTMPDATLTCNSGAKFGDGDIKHPFYVVEAKEQPSNGPISVSEKDLKQVMRQALTANKEPMVVVWNRHGKWAVLKYDHICELLENFKL